MSAPPPDTSPEAPAPATPGGPAPAGAGDAAAAQAATANALGPADPDRGQLLLRLARQAIAAALGVPAGKLPPDRLAEPWLRAPGACFVTLTRLGQLRGCIGSVRAARPLLDDVRANARAAALGDPRFPPLTAPELAATRIEVSLLSAPEPLGAAALATEDEVLAVLRPGVDGLILEHAGEARATFLPQVWDVLPEPRDFLAQLKLKAGLPADFWSPEVVLRRYTVVKWTEPEAT